ncbi:MAG: MOSC domain-containing protein [Desulfobulbaceae bacterium]|nr:MOSC domain-containing protein [Desulfobulbaceae bacterium]HIJ79744.1 MOSC domain-containing protein [Deltaproteobacteria bacterium]
MLIEALNIGLPKPEIFAGKKITSGIGKLPTDKTVAVTATGFTGDGNHDTKHHGGEDKAVCAYSVDHYPYWQKLLGISLPAAPFGENLSISNINEDEISIGDSFAVGSAILQVSQPRQPCKTLAARFARNDLVKLVVDSGFTGFYFRVLQAGEIKAGDRLSLIEKDPANITVTFANRVYHHDRHNKTAMEQVLAVAALSDSWRKSFEELLAKCG